MILESAMGSKAKIRILYELSKNRHESLSGLAGACGMSKKVVYESLLELESLGLAGIDKSAKSWKIELEKNALAEEMKRLFRLEEKLSVDFIVENLPKDEIEEIYWTGSTRAGTSKPSSDIDITVVSNLQKYETYKKLREKLAGIEKSLRRAVHVEVVPKARLGSSREFLLEGKKVYGKVHG